MRRQYRTTTWQTCFHIVALQDLGNSASLVLDGLVEDLPHNAVQALERPLEPRLLGVPPDMNPCRVREGQHPDAAEMVTG